MKKTVVSKKEKNNKLDIALGILKRTGCNYCICMTCKWFRWGSGACKFTGVPEPIMCELCISKELVSVLSCTAYEKGRNDRIGAIKGKN